MEMQLTRRLIHGQRRVPISTGFTYANSAVILSGASGSNGMITLTTDNMCQSPKSVTRTIYVGGPVITNATVNGSRFLFLTTFTIQHF